MPRNASGVYSKPSGTTAVSGATASSAKYNELADDVGTEITALLPRDGSAAMTAPLEHSSGTVSLPSVTFSAETSFGLYRVGSGSFAFAVGGVSTIAWTASAFTYGGSTVWHAGNDGTGSGLDADTLDGSELSALALAPGGSTDNVVIRADGTGGKATQDSSVVIDDSDNVSGIGTLATTGAITVGGSTVWHAGNDGAGSGLDADTVDGVEAASLVQTSRTLTAGTGLSGGGTLASNRTFNVDVDGLSALTTHDRADTVIVYDDSASAEKKMTVEDLVGALVMPAVICRFAFVGNPGAATATTWTKYALTHKTTDTISATLSSGILTLPTGTYRIEWQMQVAREAQFHSRLYNASDSTVIDYGSTVSTADLESGTSFGTADSVTFASPKGIRLEYWLSLAGETYDLGRNAGSGASLYEYGVLKVWKIL